MSAQLPEIDNLAKLFLQNVPLLDVRAPVEFTKGAFPEASNIPLLDDAQRSEVGIRYKEEGQAKALALGHELVSGELKRQKLLDWQKFVEANPHGALYCFRGGQRSRIVQEWLLAVSGISYPRVRGGYKRMRRFLLDTIEKVLADSRVLVIGGRTGSSKTRFINDMANGIDLESFAKHRGSAFGNMLEPQPAQINFENALAIKLLQLHNSGADTIILEDEGGHIGQVSLPEKLKHVMSTSELIILETALDDRVNAILQEYVLGMNAEYSKVYGQDTGFGKFSSYLLSSLEKIKKRLGGERYFAARSFMLNALNRQEIHGVIDEHKNWIEYLLDKYYDPMYDYQIFKKQERVIFTGTAAEVKEYLEGNSS